MSKNKINSNIYLYLFFGILLLSFINSCTKEGKSTIDEVLYGDTFKIISSTSTSKMDEDIINFGKKNNIEIEIEHHGDLEIVDILNKNSTSYDAVWISNSIWLYMLDNPYLTTDSKSIVINPVVLGITKSKAQELNLINKDIYNKDILNIIKETKIYYVFSYQN